MFARFLRRRRHSLTALVLAAAVASPSLAGCHVSENEKSGESANAYATFDGGAPPTVVTNELPALDADVATPLVHYEANCLEWQTDWVFATELLPPLLGVAVPETTFCAFFSDKKEEKKEEKKEDPNKEDPTKKETDPKEEEKKEDRTDPEKEKEVTEGTQKFLDEFHKLDEGPRKEKFDELEKKRKESEQDLAERNFKPDPNENGELRVLLQIGQDTKMPKDAQVDSRAAVNEKGEVHYRENPKSITFKKGDVPVDLKGKPIDIPKGKALKWILKQIDGKWFMGFIEYVPGDKGGDTHGNIGIEGWTRPKAGEFTGDRTKKESLDKLENYRHTEGDLSVNMAGMGMFVEISPGKWEFRVTPESGHFGPQQAHYEAAIPKIRELVADVAKSLGVEIKVVVSGAGYPHFHPVTFPNLSSYKEAGKRPEARAGTGK